MKREREKEEEKKKQLRVDSAQETVVTLIFLRDCRTGCALDKRDPGTGVPTRAETSSFVVTNRAARKRPGRFYEESGTPEREFRLEER